MSHSYTYDPLYRLSSATGTYAGADNKTASYTLAMGYDNMHRITSKKQHLSQTGVQFDGTLNAGYELSYSYGSEEGKKFQLDNVRDINYRTEEVPTDSTTINNGHKYEYDANGNLVYINTSRVKRDGKEDDKASEQKFKWDEENRLLAVDENGYVSNYWYDANGERTVKESGGNQAVYVNSEFAGGRTNTAKFSLYVSPFFVATQGGRYTKHIYIGNQRIVSKLGDLASYGQDPRRIPYAGTVSDAISVDYDTKYALQQQVIKDNYETFEVPYNGEDNNEYVNGQSFCCEDDTPKSMQTRAGDNFHDKDAYEKLQFYYHPDHLGSSSYITNLDGEVSQHIEYVPFGEVFIEERNNTWNTPYLFNAKELDEETGMYYYGARYYDPRLRLWMSCDRLSEKYPQLSSYNFCAENPMRFEDLKGDSLKLSSFISMDKTNKTDNLNKLIDDLSKITGLSIFISNEYLQYEKDANGNPIIISQGSKTAENFLVGIIDGSNIDVYGTKRHSKTSSGGNQVGLCASQIEDFIKNTHNLDPRTLGWGMTFLHELYHTGPGGSLKDAINLYGTGDVVDRMNVIRKELNENNNNRFGQRLSYKSITPDEDGYVSFIPFDSSSLENIKRGDNPCDDSKYIRVEIPK